MAKAIPDTILDAELALLTDATRLCVCSAQPTTYAQAVTDYMLAVKTITSSDFTGPSADTSTTPVGRKVVVNAQNGVSVTNGGTATYIALAKSTDSSLKAVTTCTSQVLTAGNTVNIPAWTLHNPNPS
jgi:hypothetical protein